MSAAPARWYLARLRAMSAPEIAWRVSSEVRRQLRPRATDRRAVRWDAGPWPELVRHLVDRSPHDFEADAGRIAAGELRFWNREARVSPHAIPWERGPFAAEADVGLEWALDPKCVWELARAQHLLPLAAGAYRAGNRAWARLCVEQMLDPAAQADRGGSGYEAAHRLVSWLWALPLVADAVANEERDRLMQKLGETAGIVREHPSRYSSANNHRLAELVGLLAFELVADDMHAWRRVWAELEHEVTRQVFADGGSREQAAGYFLYVLEIVWVGGLLAHAARQPLGAVAERATAMLAWLDTIAADDGEPPPFGDDAEDRFVRVEYFAPRRAPAIAARVDALLRGEPELTPAVKPRTVRRSAALRESGHVVLRSTLDGNDVRVVFDVGPLGLGTLAAHGHADALAVTVDAGSATLLRDSGTGSYLPAAGRDAYRLTTAHNAVVVEGASQAVPAGPHLWGRRYEVDVEAVELAADVDYTRASHDGYLRLPERARTTRSVVFVKPDLLVVLDRVTAERPCTATLIWQTLPGYRIDAPGAGAAAAVTASPEAERIESTGPFSRSYTELGTAPQTRFRATGVDVAFATALALAGGRPPATELRHAPSVTALEIGPPWRLRVVERWAGNSVLVENSG